VAVPLWVIEPEATVTCMFAAEYVEAHPLIVLNSAELAIAPMVTAAIGSTFA
jgi:hypothetical protein